MRNSLLALLLSIAPLSGVSIMDPRWPGIEIEFKALVEPEDAGLAELPGGVLMGAARVHRLVQDPRHQVYFGYDVVLEASADGRNFQIRVEPLSASRETLQRSGMNQSWTRLPLPSIPVIPQVRVGAMVKLDLLVNRGSGQKIVDSITVRERGEAKSAPRDFAVADAELDFRQVQLRIDGSPIATGSTGTRGAAVWFHAPGHGRFVFSLAPHPELGFTRLGVISGTRLTIAAGSIEYRLDSTDVIASSTGTFYVYGRHDKDWTYRGGAFVMGSADRPASIR